MLCCVQTTAVPIAVFFCTGFKAAYISKRGSSKTSLWLQSAVACAHHACHWFFLLVCLSEAAAAAAAAQVQQQQLGHEQQGQACIDHACCRCTTALQIQVLRLACRHFDSANGLQGQGEMSSVHLLCTVHVIQLHCTG